MWLGLLGQLTRNACRNKSVVVHDIVQDLPEARKLGGIKDCPDCVKTTNQSREDIDHGALKARAIAAMMTSGTLMAGRAVLHEASLSDTHLKADCPLFGYIPHLDASCMPGDRLHLQ